MGKKVPLVIYKNGERQIVGECELDDDKIFATVTDEETAKKLMRDSTNMEHFSIGEDEVSKGQAPKHHNVFDTKEKG